MKKSLGPKTLVVPTPVWIVGTYDEAGRPNGAAVAWGGVCCSSPPCVAISLRAATYTHGNIQAKKAFTISIPSEKHVAEADYFGMVSGDSEDKFAKTGLTPVRSELVDAPYIEEFPVVLECTLLQAADLGQHTQFIGEILEVKADESVLGERGFPDIEKVRPILFTPGVRVYHGVGGLIDNAYSIGRKFQ
ncbi:MAG: flavin reductase family protein [Candidatus Nealsonbacteria bacterium]|nr:flavin reductase family protein [Candidatus Nealsonbacteria bacterium]